MQKKQDLGKMIMVGQERVRSLMTISKRLMIQH